MYVSYRLLLFDVFVILKVSQIVVTYVFISSELI